MTATHAPFYGVVTDVSDCTSMEQVVGKVPYFGKEVTGQPIHRPDGTVLEAYKEPLVGGQPTGAVVGANFGFVQPSANIELGQWLMDHIGARPVAAGHWRDGRRSILELEVPAADFTINRGGRQDQFAPRIAILDAIDGSRMRDLALLFYQLWCMNQWPSVKADGRAKRMRHGRRIMDRQGEAKLFLADVMANATKEKDELQRLEDTRLTSGQFFTFAAQLFTGKDQPDQALKVIDDLEGRAKATMERKFQTLATLFQKGTGNRGATALDAFSAVTEWRTWGGQVDEDQELMARITAHEVRQIGASRLDEILKDRDEPTVAEVTLTPEELHRTTQRFESNLGGTSAALVARARTILMEYAKAA